MRGLATSGRFNEPLCFGTCEIPALFGPYVRKAVK